MLVVLTGVVTVLTLFFNLCGALSVAVVAGMMSGASRRWQWQSIYVSLVCPIVVLVLGKITKVDLAIPQRLSLAAVCFGAFWGTYLVTFLLMRMEKQSETAPGHRTSRQSSSPQEAGTNPQLGNAPATCPIPDVALPANELSDPFGLHHLQGTWHCETKHPKKSSHKKVFAITQDKFSLSIVNASGHARLIAQGSVLLQDAFSANRLILSEVADNGSAPPR